MQLASRWFRSPAVLGMQPASPWGPVADAPCLRDVTLLPAGSWVRPPSILGYSPPVVAACRPTFPTGYCVYSVVGNGGYGWVLVALAYLVAFRWKGMCQRAAWLTISSSFRFVNVGCIETGRFNEFVLLFLYSGSDHYVLTAPNLKCMKQPSSGCSLLACFVAG